MRVGANAVEGGGGVLSWTVGGDRHAI
eukprot:SAG11_NODE_33992_length_274_cov_0.868571_1_plen_26_part_01